MGGLPKLMGVIDITNMGNFLVGKEEAVQIKAASEII